VAIVSEIAGTTRDVVETHLSIAGVAVKISDTAGIHETEDKIEAEGIRRALKKASEADLKIFLIDAKNPVLRADLIDENTIIVVNKIDLESFNFDGAVEISLTNNVNTTQLLKKLAEKILELIPNQNSPLTTQERYRSALRNSVANLESFSLEKNIELAAEDLRMTAREIGKITGKVDIENILDVIFSRFCIGK
jgi:tRNA modification GTPase